MSAEAPVVAPRKVRADLLYLRPDLSRPGLVLRSRPDAAALNEPGDPYSVMQRVESELAGEASRYRWILLIGSCMALMPGLLAAAAWFYFLYAPLDLLIDPFRRGRYVPVLSVYEAMGFFLLAMFLVSGGSYIADSLKAMRRLGVDYRRLRDAEESQREQFAIEASSGRWPRARALLMKARGFEAYRALLDPGSHD